MGDPKPKQDPKPSIPPPPPRQPDGSLKGYIERGNQSTPVTTPERGDK